MQDYIKYIGVVLVFEFCVSSMICQSQSWFLRAILTLDSNTYSYFVWTRKINELNVGFNGPMN